jgi:hypothetical protein
MIPEMVAGGPTMRPKHFLPPACGLLALTIFSSWPLSLAANRPGNDFAVHEWGTFTSIAGSDGKAITWSPLDGSNDLPAFVEHFRDNTLKASLAGTVRMETPVMYFYGARKMKVSVKVDFAKGLITEWYPHASERTPAASNTPTPPGRLFEQAFAGGSISWNSITLDPSLAPNFPREAAPSRYYAARATAAIPLRVATANGTETEKFLFYRGVSAFEVPIAATTTDGKITARDLTTQPIPEVILFERRGDKVGYRIGGALSDGATLELPELTANVDLLETELRAMLIRQGLYPDEASAMVATWRDSWFEEGSRLIYAVPAQFVNSILPLDIDPTPAHTVRVFVGRTELITPATEQAVEAALKTQDDTTLAKYGRFLTPIFEEIVRRKDKTDADALRSLDAFYLSRQYKKTLAPVQ